MMTFRQVDDQTEEEVIVTVADHTTLPEILERFKGFLQACTFVLGPEDEIIVKTKED